MLLITSAFPKLKRLDENGQDVGAELVGRCLRSWQENGFRVLSVHNEAERDFIGDGFPGVEYRFVAEQLGPEARKTPSFAALFADLDPDEPVGLINADIFMAPTLGFADRLAAAAVEGTVVMHRWDVPSLDRRKGRKFELGVDLIAFTPRRIWSALEPFLRLPYQLGVPWWDYALPVAASLHGPLLHVADPILLHHLHDQAWNSEEWHRFARISAGYLAEVAAAADADPGLAKELGRRLKRIRRETRGIDPAKERDYLLASLTIRWVQVFSERNARSLIAEMDLPSNGRELDNPDDSAVDEWMDDDDPAEIDEATILRRGRPRREFPGATALAIYDEISTESSSGQVIAAGLRDIKKIVLSTGKLLERRVRRKRRGHS